MHRIRRTMGSATKASNEGGLLVSPTASPGENNAVRLWHDLQDKSCSLPTNLEKWFEVKKFEPESTALIHAGGNPGAPVVESKLKRAQAILWRIEHVHHYRLMTCPSYKRSSWGCGLVYYWLSPLQNCWLILTHNHVTKHPNMSSTPSRSWNLRSPSSQALRQVEAEFHLQPFRHSANQNQGIVIWYIDVVIV